jgi:multisubunit Na+/H+ antiporter MnhG subunit
MALFTPTTGVLKTVPEIIRAASASALGILALLIVILGVLAYVYFKSAPIKIRIGIFIALLFGASLYAFAIEKAAQSSGMTAIDGMVADAEKGDSIDLATVTTTLSASPAVTDSNGVFHLKIRTPDPGEPIVLHVAKSGYETIDWTVTPPIVEAVRVLLRKD